MSVKLSRILRLLERGLDRNDPAAIAAALTQLRIFKSEIDGVSGALLNDAPEETAPLSRPAAPRSQTRGH